MPKRAREEADSKQSAAPLSAIAARRLRQEQAAAAAVQNSTAESPSPVLTPKPDVSYPSKEATPRKKVSRRVSSSSVQAVRGEDEIVVATRTTSDDEDGDVTMKNVGDEVNGDRPMSIQLTTSSVTLVSNFQPTDDNFELKTTYDLPSAVFRMNYEETLVFQGEYLLEVLSGNVTVNGARLGPEDGPKMVFAPSTHSLPVIECSSKRSKRRGNIEGYYAEILVKSVETGLKALGSIAPVFRNIWKPRDCEAIGSFAPIFSSTSPPQIVQIPSSWISYMKGVKEAARLNTPTVLISGQKGVGKSTFSRILANFLLTETRFKTIAYLDLDPGQPEFTPPTILSLQIIKSPILGPPFTHCMIGADSTALALNYGFITARDEPGLYTNCARALHAKYLDIVNGGEDIPVIINTAGWTKGLGLELIQDFLSFMVPSDFVFLDSNELPIITVPKETRQILLSPTPIVSQRFTAASIRQLQTTSHLHQTGFQSWNFTPLTHKPPVIFPYPSTTLIELLSESLPEGEYATALLGTVVALLIPPSDFPETPTAPYLLSPGPHIPAAPCVALAVVRAIDTEKQEVQLLVGGGGAETLEKLGVESVLISRGRAELPVWELACGVSSGWVQESSAGVWRARRNLMRRGMESG